MVQDLDNLAPVGMPAFLGHTEKILKILQSMDYDDLKSLWKCNDGIAQLNAERLNSMDLYHQLTPAIFSYEGIQYQYMAPKVLEQNQLDYIQSHLRILSGFYGVLRPFDGVTPYRLEMQARMSLDGHKDLYHFWGKQLADALNTDCIINLASKEYSKAILPHLPKETQVITCRFVEEKQGKLVEKATMCKMARGQMVRWMAENQIEKPDEIQNFDCLNFQFSLVHSTEMCYTFVQTLNAQK